MSTQKNTQKKGFTLVEVIVVAVIVAILAAVAIPIYQQYVTDSRLNSATSAAGSIASFMGACNAKSGTADPLTLTGADETSLITCSYTDGAVDKTTTVLVPLDVEITISAATGSGTVTGVHTKCATATDCTKVMPY